MPSLIATITVAVPTASPYSKGGTAEYDARRARLQLAIARLMSEAAEIAPGTAVTHATRLSRKAAPEGPGDAPFLPLDEGEVDARMAAIADGVRAKGAA